MKKRVAIVAALEQEIKAAVKGWRISHREYQGCRFKFFENEHAVAVCAGIGPEAGRRAAEAIISLYAPESILSAGFAGALDPALQVGELVLPRLVIDSTDGSRTEIPTGTATLVSFASVADEAQKAKLAKAYGAQAVDMEAAAVARSANAHRIEFMVVKVISDEVDTPLPPIERFVTDGRFRTAAFGVFVAVRPWLWPRTLRLAKNSLRASRSLGAWLNQYNGPEFLKNKPADLHPMNKAQG
jgi:adenosylhomocysteine nucleosidase